MPFYKIMLKNKWPKPLPKLTASQEDIRDKWMFYWHEKLPTSKFALMEKFNQYWGFKRDKLPLNCTTLEIGVGLGGHIPFEDLSIQKYYALDLRPDMVFKCSERFPEVKVLLGDIQKPLELPDKFFDRIIAVNVLEHLNNLPEALTQIRRLLKSTGFCEFIIPFEGKPIYSIARALSTSIVFKRTFKMSYDWCIKSEHCNTCEEILKEVDIAGFRITWKRFFPFLIPSSLLNLALGIRCEFK